MPTVEDKIVQMGVKKILEAIYECDFLDVSYGFRPNRSVCFQYRDEAEAFSQTLRERLARFGLNISEEKSRVIEFGRYPWEKAQRQRKRTATFDFWGFTHHGDITWRTLFLAEDAFLNSRMRENCTFGSMGGIK